MERLTKRYTYDGKNHVSVDSMVNGVSCSNFCAGCGEADCEDIRKALFKLAEYEDLEDRLRTVYGNFDGLLDKAVGHLERHSGTDFTSPAAKARLLTDEDVDRWEEYKTLEEQGKLLKLPCAVGDTVYYLYDGMKIEPMRVEKIIIAKYGINLLLAYCGSDEELKYWKINIESTAIDCKIVFLTKEEAEAALKALEQGQI